MKITNFTFLEDSLIVYFDVEFKQINYVKMESPRSDSHGILECEEMEIKYSKKKNILKLFTNKMTNIIVLLITIFDNKNTCYSYYISRTKNLENVENVENVENSVSNMDLMASGFTQLFKTENTVQSSSEIKICPIKNQNIFANIKKKV